jgi:GTPase SAR1 family protein
VVGGLPVFAKASDVSGKAGLGLLIFGPSGAGKTSLASTAQDSEYGRDVLFFMLDPGGADSIRDREDISLWPSPDAPKPTWKDFRTVVDQVVAAGKDSPYKTLVFDSISSIYDDLIKVKITGSAEKQPQLNQWGEANRYLIKFMMDVLSLNAQGINTIFIGHTKEERDEDTVLIRLAGTPQARDEILRNIGNVAYLDFDARKTKRILKLKPERKIEGPKMRLPQSIKDVPLEYTDPTMHDIFSAWRKTT